MLKLLAHAPIRTWKGNGMKNLLVTLAIFGLVLATGTSAKVELVKHKELNFSVSTNQVMKGAVEYSFKKVSPKKLKDKYPDIVAFDTLGFLKKRKGDVLISKYAF